MTNRRFPFRRLPDDLCSEVVKTMEHFEIIAYSLLSKNTLSLVQSLRLPLENARIHICEWPDVLLNFGNNSTIYFLLNRRVGLNDKEIMILDASPVNVRVTTRKPSQGFPPNIESEIFPWSNQQKSIREWIQHLCSIFQCDCYEATFSLRNIRFDIQSLRNTFPKLKETVIQGFLEDEPNDQDIQNTQIILRAFLPYVQNFRLVDVPLQESFSIQHIGMANLKELELYSLRNLKLDDILTLNAECCIIYQNQFSLRDLNRFFKLWKKGSYAKLRYLEVYGENIADWNALMKGLQPEETRRLQAEIAGAEKRSRIRNCYGIWAKIKMFNIGLDDTVTLTVLTIK
ncbi:unnamed protein product [Caenorhabditis nigoni]